MRQATSADVVWALKYTLRTLSRSMRNDLASKDHDKRKRAEQFVAEWLEKEALSRFEILASGEPGAMVESLCEKAAFGEGSLVYDEDTTPLGPVVRG